MKAPGCVWVALLGVVPHAVAADRATDRGETLTRPRIALVLSGGAARGAAHVGVLKVLEP